MDFSKEHTAHLRDSGNDTNTRENRRNELRSVTGIVDHDDEHGHGADANLLQQTIVDVVRQLTVVDRHGDGFASQLVRDRVLELAGANTQ